MPLNFVSLRAAPTVVAHHNQPGDPATYRRQGPGSYLSTRADSFRNGGISSAWAQHLCRDRLHHVTVRRDPAAAYLSKCSTMMLTCSATDMRS